MKHINLLFTLLIASAALNAQVSGKISDSETSRTLTGAHVILYDSGSGSVIAQDISNKTGDFQIEEVTGERMTLVISYVGYQTHKMNLEAGKAYTGLEIKMQPSPLPVGEVVVSTLRQEKLLKDIAMPISLLDAEEIDKSAGITPSEMLGNEPGLYLARDGVWATSLNIRGLSEQRIVTLIDGNRVETATDIAAGMAMVDVNDIERIEVIKGAASSLYGTGALGGVVNIITKDGYFNDGLYATGAAGFSYQTVNSMHSEHAAVSAGDKKWYFRLSGTLRDAENTMTPEGELENSQFKDNNLSLKAGVRPFEDHELRINLQRYRAFDVGIPGGRSFPQPASATYPKENRDLVSADYSIKLKGEILKDISLKYYHQFILRDVELKPNPNVTITPSGYHTTNGISLHSRLTPFKGHNAVAGIDVWQRNLETERYKDIYQPIKDSAGNVVGTNHIFRAETPIPETDFTSAGIFLNDEFSALEERLKISLGGRFDLINVRNEQAVDPEYIIMNDVRMDTPPNQRITFEARDVYNNSWSANLGLVYSLIPDVDLTASLSRAFRSPSIEERYKYIDLGATVNIGDPDLEPEDGYFVDLGIKVWKDRFHFSLNGFVNSMSNLIVAEPGEIEYSYTDDPERIDTIPAFINANVDQALLYGYDMSFSYNVYSRLVLFGSSAFVRGIDSKNDEDLPLIPPLNGRIGLRYKTLKGYGLETLANLVADQDKVAEGETATKGYASYDLRLFTPGINLGFARLKFFGGIENITDRAYVNHLSTNRGLIKYEPGRNFYVRMRLSF